MQLRLELSESDVRTRTQPLRSPLPSFDDLLFAAGVAGLAWVPLWFGSERPVAWGINAALFGALVIAYEAGVRWRGRAHAVAVGRVALPAACIAVVAIWCLLQASTWLQASSQAPIWQLARETLQANIAGSISVNRDATIVALLRLLTAACAFWLMLQLCRSSLRARRLVGALAVIGAGYAAYGIVAFFGFPGTILWFTKFHYLDSLTATFVNRNTYAAYGGIGLVCALVRLSGTVSDAVRRGEGRMTATLLAAFVGPVGIWLAMACLIAVALVLTGSRGGIAAAFAGVTTAAVITGLQGRRGRTAKLIGGTIVALILLGAVLVSFGDLLASRLNRHGLEAPDRIAVYELTAQSIADRPLTGFGYGTFQHVFPMYRDARLGVMRVWDRAHNTYLEIVQGLGIPAALALFTGVALLLYRCFAGALRRRRALTAPTAASAVSVALLLHACVDFSLQSQAVALTWMALLGAGVAQSWSSRVATDA